MGPKFNGWCLYKRKERDRHTQAHRGEGPVTMEAETEMMPLSPGTPKTAGSHRRGEEGPSLAFFVCLFV